MKQIDLNSWEEFKPQLDSLHTEYAKTRKSPSSRNPFIFRGLPDSQYFLSTTLERIHEKEMSFAEYYELISRIQPQVESFTGKVWRLPERDSFFKSCKTYDQIFISRIWGMDGYSYMIYLRHHGFPSPLLDWTKSPYVAAYFAFRSLQKPKEGRVAIYVFCEYFEHGKLISSDAPTISECGSYINTHKRHFLQQGTYTICHQFKDQEWFYVPHDKVFEKNTTNQDVLWKFTLPWDERTKVLKLLDDYNLNAYSLFNAEEALMETMALRELTFRS